MSGIKSSTDWSKGVENKHWAGAALLGFLREVIGDAKIDTVCSLLPAWTAVAPGQTCQITNSEGRTRSSVHHIATALFQNSKVLL